MTAIKWNLFRTVEPGTVVPVTDLMDQVRLTGPGELVLIEAKGKAAEEAIEDELGVALLTQTLVLRLDRFPYWELPLPRPPLQSVTSVQYVDTAGVTQVLASSEYTVDAPPTNGRWRAKAGRIQPAYSKTWPSTRDVPNAVIVTYVAGATKSEDVPELVRQGILMTFADLWENRERSAPEAVRQLEFYERLLGNHRCVTEFNYQ